MAALTDGMRLRIAEGTALFVLLGFVPVAHAQSNADSAFESVAAAFVNDLPALSPINATLIGDHRQDGTLDQVDSDGRATTVRLYEKHLAALQSIEWQALSRANQVDADLLLNEIESRLWQLVSLQEWAWNPLIYVDLSGSAIYGLMARDFDRQVAEIQIRIAVLNRYTALGIPVTEPVG